MIFDFFKKMFGKVGPFLAQVAQTAIGMFAEAIKEEAMEAVRQAKNAPKGTNKYEYAFSILKDKFPDAKTAALNFAIEAAVAIVDP